jgi:hypothetical protein
MTDTYPPTVQRPALLEFAAALNSRANALRRDECSDWRIEGDAGHIYAVPGGFQIFVLGCETIRQWGAAVKAFKSFARVTNDGDTEGAFFLNRLPEPSEAATIRRYVGVAKRREIGEEELARLRQWAADNPGFRAAGGES